jgi:uncharacterized protein (DUF1499 family)
MEQLLAKLRINYSLFTLLQGVFDTPKEGTLKMHSKFLDGFLEGQNDQCFVSDEERIKLREKTFLHLRLREMLREHSNKASLVVMSLPMPRLVRRTTELVYVSHVSYLLSFILERSLSAALYVLVGDADARYAAIFTRSWQSNIGLDLQFLRPCTSPPFNVSSDLLFQL